MSRLTKRLQEGKALCIEVCEKECTEGYYECHKCKPFADVLKKLAEYEDIGTVEDLLSSKSKNLLKRYGSFGNMIDELEEYRTIGKLKECEVAVNRMRYKEPIDRCMFKECPNCGNVEIADCRHCPDCGQKLIE